MLSFVRLILFSVSDLIFPLCSFQAHGIDHLVLPTRDYLFAPSFVDISRAVDFIHSELIFLTLVLPALFLEFFSGNMVMHNFSLERGPSDTKFLDVSPSKNKLLSD